MNRWTVLFVAMVIATLVTLGCSNGGGNPTVPTNGTDLTASSQGSTQNPATYLWGYYDVTIDPATKSITAVPDRTTMFSANVVEFLNGNPTAMTFTMNTLNIGLQKITVDIDVGISHPFFGMPQFNGYDVKGVFMGNGSETMSYDSQVDYPVYEVDQYMLDDPEEEDGGGPDGYTRWFNATEFMTSGMFGYIEGDMASKDYLPNATVSPYRYYSDGIDEDEDVFEYLTANASDFGVFSTGETNTRNYYLEFPVPMPSALYGYAVIASWEDNAIHPANAPEAQALSVTITPDIYFVDGTDSGGDLVLEFDVWCWEDQPTDIFIESGVLLNAYKLSPAEMTPVGGGLNYSTYHVEVTADNIQFNSGTDGDSDYWIICEAGAYDYKNDGFNPTGPSDTLAAFFRYPLFIADEPYNADPICELLVITTMPAEWYTEVPVEFDASGSTDPDIGDVLSFEWDFDGDDAYDEDPDDSYTGDPDNPTHTYTDDYVGDVNVRVTDGNGGEAICSEPVDVTVKSCGTLTCPSGSPTTMIGSNRLYFWNPEPTRNNSTPRVIAAWVNAYYMCALNATGTGAYYLYYNGAYIYNVAMASTDRLYIHDSSGSNRVWYRNYNNGWSGKYSWGTTLPSGWYVWRMCIDEDDNPVVLARGGSSQARVYHWTGSSWGTGVDVPASIMSKAANNYGYIEDFDYDPTTGYYYIAERYHPGTISAFDANGDVMWEDNTIWTPGPTHSSWMIGIFIDKEDPECRLLVMSGYNTSNQTTYWARYNPGGGEKVTGTTSGGTYGSTFSTFQGRGCVQVFGSTARFLGSTYGGNVWSSTIVPNW